MSNFQSLVNVSILFKSGAQLDIVGTRAELNELTRRFHKFIDGYKARTDSYLDAKIGGHRLLFSEIACFWAMDNDGNTITT